MIDFAYFRTVNLETKASDGIGELLQLQRSVAIRALFKDLLLFGLIEWDLKVFAELHKLAQINLIHTLLKLFELLILGDVLATIETENFSDASSAKFSDIVDDRLFLWRCAC